MHVPQVVKPRVWQRFRGWVQLAAWATSGTGYGGIVVGVDELGHQEGDRVRVQRFAVRGGENEVVVAVPVRPRGQTFFRLSTMVLAQHLHSCGVDAYQA